MTYFAAVLLIFMFCADNAQIVNSQCPDGSPVHRTEIRLLSADYPDGAITKEIKSLIVVIRDGNEILNIPADMLTPKEIEGFLQTFQPK